MSIGISAAALAGQDVLRSVIGEGLVPRLVDGQSVFGTREDSPNLASTFPARDPNVESSVVVELPVFSFVLQRIFAAQSDYAGYVGRGSESDSASQVGEVGIASKEIGDRVPFGMFIAGAIFGLIVDGDKAGPVGIYMGADAVARFTIDVNDLHSLIVVIVVG